MMTLLMLMASLMALSAAALHGTEDSSLALKPTLDAVEAAVQFMGNNVETVNLDGAIGLRSVEGQSGALLAHYWTQLPAWVVARLMDLRGKAARAARMAEESVKRRTPLYFANAGQMISGDFWVTFYPTRQLPPPPKPRMSKTEAAAAAAAGDFDEKFSDDCIHEFHGLNGQPRCTVSEKCWRVIVLPDSLSDYALTHQLFYLMNGIQANCLANLTAALLAHPPAESDGTLAGLFDSLCARVFGEALSLEKNGLPLAFRDLFMEQIGLCGLAGYTQVAQWRWLPLLLKWQLPSGCYGQFRDEQLDPRNFDSGRYGNMKRAESRMPDGCLSHRTSVALDALMAFVRRILERGLEAES